MELLNWIGNFGFSTLRLATPVIYAALAAVISKKAGMFNMALEGMMLNSALAGVLCAGAFDNVWLGLIGAIVVGILSGAIIAFANISGKTDLFLTCIAYNLIATGGTVFIMYLFTGEKSNTSSAIKGFAFPVLDIPIVQDIPLIGKIISGHNILTYIAFVCIFASWFFLYKTRLGLRLRAVGESPQAASSVGISVEKIKKISFLISGFLCGLGGAFMSMGWVSFFMKNMVNGRGFIGLSAMSIADGEPVLSGIAAVLFGFSDAVATALKSQGGQVPTEFIDMIPYVITIIVLVVVSLIRRSKMRKIERLG